MSQITPEVVAAHSITPDEYERYLGWDTAPNEGDDMVVEDTLIYPNKSFKLFGKN